MDILVFELSGGLYALPAHTVRRVIRAVAVASLPRAPKIIEGAFSLHGAIVPVLDVRTRFGLAPKALAASDHFILTEASGRPVAIRVDRTAEFASVADKAIQHPDRFAPSDAIFAGIAPLPGGLVLIHDLDAFLTAAEALSLDAALAAEAVA